MTLKDLLKLFADNGCTEVYAKELAPNDNPKNQIYLLQGDWALINIFPLSDVALTRFNTLHASLNFYWIDISGRVERARHAKLILYPQYPEFRLSGYNMGCSLSPDDTWNARQSGRFLYLGINKTDEKIFAFATQPSNPLNIEFLNAPALERYHKLFKLSVLKPTRERVIEVFKEIYQQGWIDSKRLNKHGNVLPCNSSQCGGFTLEAELGIIPNSRSEPDYLGYEIKQYGVNKCTSKASPPITLMTPEPQGGVYKTVGVEYFLDTYGTQNTANALRRDFTGTHRTGKISTKSNLKLIVDGYDALNRVFTNARAFIALIDNLDNPVAVWYLDDLLNHWKVKHNQAIYVRSMKQHNNSGQLQYMYCNILGIGSGPDITLFMNELLKGSIYLDPAVRIERDINGRIVDQKRRNQFRASAKIVPNLYSTFETIDLNEA